MTVHNRFQVSDPMCGLIEAYSTLAEAKDRARRHDDTRQCGNVEVFDAMAHVGAVETWDYSGAPKTYREPQYG